MKIDIKNTKMNYMDLEAGTVFQFEDNPNFYMFVESYDYENDPVSGHVDLQSGEFVKYHASFGKHTITIFPDATLVSKE